MSQVFHWLTTPEFRFGDFLMPWGMVIGALGFLVAWGAVAIMEVRGWGGRVANLPLFFIALAVLFGCVFGLTFAP